MLRLPGWSSATIVLLFLVKVLLAQQDILLFQDGSSNYRLASQQTGPQVWVAKNDYPAVHRASQDLAVDFGRVLGVNGTRQVVDNLSQASKTKKAPVIIAGTIGNSTLIDGLVKAGKLAVSDITGKWESYTMALVKDISTDVPWALVIAGSNRRGTIFGLYAISEKIGVSPWYWWADVPPKTKTGVWVRDTRVIQGPPSVKYRGFFINDEAPALTGWATKKFGLTATGRPFNSEFYKLVFELCLRLRANYIWPAMWGSAFYVDDVKNGPLAEEYGVVIGTSHHEPMARAEREQQQEIEGGWNWDENKAEIIEFFRGGVERARNWETMYTMGMRGEGDAASPTLTAEDLEEIIQVQQSVLKEGLNADDIGDVPQTWVLYKEVGRYYQTGMKVPDTVTLLWTDDNVGNLLRTPLANETDRSAGAGVYYHFDYVGSPRNYKWINTIQLVKTWEQMHLAYEKGAREIWIVNVGDIKPPEIPTAHFLDMAYDMSKHATPSSTNTWIRSWAAREFEERIADRTVQILSTYGKLIVRRKYELLSRKPFAYSVASYDEAERVLKEWTDLLALAQSTYDSLPQATRTTFFEMVLHPVLAGKTVVELYIKAELNLWRHKQRRTSANQLANDVHRLFAEDAQITDRYHKLNGGKWDVMMSQTHIGYTSWNEPAANTIPELRYHDQANVPRAGIMGVSVQGSNLTSPGDPEPVLLSVDPYMPASDQRYLDIYTRNNGSFTYEITVNASYVTVSNRTGTLSAPNGVSDVRVPITVDWDAAPAGLSWVGLRIQAPDAAGSWPITATLPVHKTSVLSGFKGFVESGAVVSMEAEHYSSAEEKNGLSYMTIPDYGRTLSGVKLWPVTADSQSPGAAAPKLTYDFHTFTSSASARVVVFLGATLNHDPSRPLRYAFSVDGGNPVTVQPVPTTPMGSEPSGWSQAVITGGWTFASRINLPSGKHSLHLWLLEPGVVVQKVVVDLGGFRESSLGPPESVRV
ncbi:hypothetical protein CkaCkLH20_11442 [Colletotrichum karsti]|uniref:Gylcosyl hydrolase 115 C-terminal domain-containing protein n=1 Tax=Colletotrichum karsti TaxID=1095194 RepID=A0A9P6HVR8_9PEZI|nr:uncharacterized protein CkaCkLH20_11442 [Colletotrichum karsti]KAF9871025.1 hypothetical protein CkaCkLH20_11442 [Colletotrichum karsti]